LVDVDDRGIDDVDIKNDGRVFDLATDVDAGSNVGLQSIVARHRVWGAGVGLWNAKARLVTCEALQAVMVLLVTVGEVAACGITADTQHEKQRRNDE
jgi:hypothetical protein